MPLVAIIVIVLVGLLAVGGVAMGASPKVQAIAQAIANAEGFGAPEALPTRANNPGDLKLGDLGNGEINGKTVFPDAQSGWNALYKQIGLMIDGGSQFYSVTDSWRAIARTWVGTSDYVNWLNNVTGQLGVDPDSTLAEYVNG
jgi:hypothetical protein